ncbi:hypothetical protein HNY73_014821 [Argiope bruennichi]|uniref:Uncharacterized protein n=1 Tax=Argiope bruennichi TaxID=94029 RepID=A0A8T0ES09_ARGBR|nr:hypothetical protein HNY73_014821 [Argiope bruennichi]
MIQDVVVHAMTFGILNLSSAGVFQSEKKSETFLETKMERGMEMMEINIPRGKRKPDKSFACFGLDVPPFFRRKSQRMIYLFS